MFLKWIKKNKLKIIATGICTFAMALFTIISFSNKAYAYTIDSNGNLIGDNLLQTGTEFQIGGGSGSFTRSNNQIITITTQASDFYIYTPNGQQMNSGTYTFSLTNYEHIQMFVVQEGNSWRASTPTNHTITFENTFTLKLRIDVDESYVGTLTFGIMVNSGDEAKDWEPYGLWYSEENYDALQEDYDTLSNVKNKIEQDYKTLVNVNNYGMWAYLTGYVWNEQTSLQGNIQFRGIDAQGNYVSSIKVPDRNSYSFTYEDLMRSGLLEVGGILNTTTLEEFGTYESNLRYNINCLFNHLPTNSFYMRFENVNNFTIRIMDYNDRQITLYKNSDIASFTYQDIYDIDNQFGNEIYGIWIENSAYSNNDTMGQFITYNTNTDSYNLGYADARQNYRYYIEEVEEQAQEISNLREQINKTYEDRFNEGYQEGYRTGADTNNSLYNMVIRSLQIHLLQYLNKYLILIY